MKIDFEEYLMEVHGQTYTGCDDDMPEAYEKWVTSLDVDDFTHYADMWCRKLCLQTAMETIDKILKEGE